MNLKIKLKRGGVKRKAFYRIVVIKKGVRAPLDYIGYCYSFNSVDHLDDKFLCRVDKVKLARWVSIGADISFSLRRLLVNL